jgi:aminopeptidase N
MKIIAILFNALLLFYSGSRAQDQAPPFTLADTLLGSLNPHRAYDVLRYDLAVTPDFVHRSISGKNTISFRDSGLNEMQIDLQEPLEIDSIRYGGRNISFIRNGNAFVAMLGGQRKQPDCLSCTHQLTVYFHGQPRVATKPPWDGGWVFRRDDQGNPWMSVACEEDGASIWYPCKDYLGDEPDSGASLSITIPDSLVAIGNGRLKEKLRNGNGSSTWIWEVKNPINNYDLVPYIGKYVSWHAEYPGEKGKLDEDFWVLEDHLAKAKEHFSCVDSMLRCFEYWFGPYPFYEDGYKLVEAPYLGMEHQSNIAYGNHFRQGYDGHDLSETGWGLKWDFMIVHESGHEWFGNNITAKDLGDEWIHESFTSYGESLYAAYYFGQAAGDAYIIGIRKKIENKFPVIRYYGVHHGPEDTDEYYKGSNMIHTIRQVINNDSLFRKILRGLNQTFYHRTVTTSDIEYYINRMAGRDFTAVFDQYLKTTQIPVFEYKLIGNTLQYRWTNCLPGFNLPVKINLDGTRWISPTTRWQTTSFILRGKAVLSMDPNFYVGIQNDAARASAP